MQTRDRLLLVRLFVRLFDQVVPLPVFLSLANCFLGISPVLTLTTTSICVLLPIVRVLYGLVHSTLVSACYIQFNQPILRLV